MPSGPEDEISYCGIRYERPYAAQHSPASRVAAATVLDVVHPANPDTRQTGQVCSQALCVAGGWFRQNGVRSSSPPAPQAGSSMGNAHRWLASSQHIDALRILI
jgi:hypothetical protein